MCGVRGNVINHKSVVSRHKNKQHNCQVELISESFKCCQWCPMSLSPDTGGTGDIPGAASQIRRNDPLLPASSCHNNTTASHCTDTVWPGPACLMTDWTQITRVLLQIPNYTQYFYFPYFFLFDLLYILYHIDSVTEAFVGRIPLCLISLERIRTSLSRV